MDSRRGDVAIFCLRRLPRRSSKYFVSANQRRSTAQELHFQQPHFFDDQYAQHDLHTLGNLTGKAEMKMGSVGTSYAQERRVSVSCGLAIPKYFEVSNIVDQNTLEGS